MIFRPNQGLRASLIALIAGGMLALGGCASSENEDTGKAVAATEGSAEFVELIEQAGAAMRDNRLPDAGGFLDRAFELEPENPALWVAISRLRYRGGEHLGALQAAERALEVGPTSPLALHLRGQMVRDAHGLADALPWFEAAHVAAPDDTEILADLAATLGDLGRNRDMLEAVRRLAEIDPKHPKVHYLQAVLAARAGNPVLARSLLERSAMASDNVPAALLLDTLIELQVDNTDSAALKLEYLARRQPANAQVQELHALALWRGGRDEELVRRFAERARSSDTSPYLLTLVGRAYERLGERAEAAPFLNRAAEGRARGLAVLGSTREASTMLPAPTRQLRNMIASGDRAGVRQLAASLKRQFPGSADVHSLAGDAQMALGDPEAALEDYAVAARIKRPWPLTKRMITAYRAIGDDDAADALLTRHLRGEPNNAEALVMLARRSADDEDWLRAAVLLDQAIALGAGNDPDLLELRAASAQRLGDTAKAAEFLAQARELRPHTFVSNADI